MSGLIVFHITALDEKTAHRKVPAHSQLWEYTLTSDSHVMVHIKSVPLVATIGDERDRHPGDIKDRIRAPVVPSRTSKGKLKVVCDLLNILDWERGSVLQVPLFSFV